MLLVSLPLFCENAVCEVLFMPHPLPPSVVPVRRPATMGDGMMELKLFERIATAQDPLDLGRFTHVPGWSGKCIGDCMATISNKALRVVAFQAAGSIGDVQEWVNDAVKQVIRSGAHVGVFTGTRV